MKYQEIIIRETIEYRKILLKRIKKELYEYVEYNVPLNDFFEKNIVLGRDRIIDNITREYFENKGLYENYIETKVEEFGSEDYEEYYIDDFFKKEYPEEKFIERNFNKQIIFNEMLKKVNGDIYNLFRRDEWENNLFFFIIYIFYTIMKKGIYIAFIIYIIKDYLEFKKEIINDIGELINTIFTEETLETSSIYKFIKKYDKNFNYKNKLMEELYHLTDNERKYIFEKKETKKNAKSLILTEGKTDWKHLKKSLLKLQDKGECLDLNIEFEEYEKVEMGDSELASIVRTYSKTQQNKKIIMIFDRDQIGRNGKKEIKKLFIEGQDFNNHGNNVFSLFIPKIDNRLNEICIEFYYKEEEIKNAWYNGKRLFYGNEFDSKTQISLCAQYKTDKPYPKELDILDGDNKKKVYSIDDEKYENNIALSKNDFTNNIINEVEGFNDFDIENFRLIFDVIEKIVND